MHNAMLHHQTQENKEVSLIIPRQTRTTISLMNCVAIELTNVTKKTNKTNSTPLFRCLLTKGGKKWASNRIYFS
jgi:ABC-type sulfate transport system substrate-binding protein